MMATKEIHHGNTPAAWATVCIVLVAFVVGGVGLMAGSWLVFWIAVGLLVLSVIVGKIMQAMGMGSR
ncbi:MAG: HGxxPAAW family protein [Nocardioidaceae bacterium]